MKMRNLIKRDSVTKKFILKTAMGLLGILAVVLVISLAGNHFRDSYSTESLHQTEDTVRQYAVQCYALEGSYPESLDYLVDNYMLTLNEDEYVYHYKFIGSNMMPDITVFPAM